MAKRATTFADLRDGNNNFHQCLMEMKVREKIVGTWTNQGPTYPNTYAITITQRPDDHNLRGVDATYWIAAAETSMTTLTSRASIALCNSNVNSFHWAGVVLYVNVGADPTIAGTIVDEFWLYFSMGGETPGEVVSFNGQDYRPLLRSVPSVIRASADPNSGTPVTGGGTVALNNPQSKAASWELAAAALDAPFEAYIWNGAEVRVFFGGDDLAIGAYQRVFTGKVKDAIWTDNGVEFQVEDICADLNRSLNLTRLVMLDFTGASALTPTDRIIPICYGGVQRVKALLREVSSLMFQVTTHSNVSLERFFVGDKEVIPLYVYRTGDLYGNSFHLPEHWRKAVLQDGKEVTVDLVGKADASSRALTNPSDVAEDVLVTYGGKVAGDLVSADFDESRLRSAPFHVALAIVAPTTTREILDRICRTCLAFVYPTAAGLITFDVWNPVRSDVTVDRALRDYDGSIGPLRVSYNNARIYTDYVIESAPESSSARAASAAAISSLSTIYTESDGLAYALAGGRRERLNLNNTALEDIQCAALLVQRLRLFYGAPTMRATFPSNKRLYDLTVNDILSLTRTRAPDRSGGGWTSRLFRIVQLELVPGVAQSNVICDDLWARASANYSKVKANGSSTWLASSVSDQQLGGYWLDDDGMADATDLGLAMGYWG